MFSVWVHNLMPEIISIQNSMLTHQFQFSTIAAIVCPCSNNCAGIPMPLLYLTDRIGWGSPKVALTITCSSPLFCLFSICDWGWKEIGQMGLDSDWTASRTSSSMRLAEGLVKIVVYRIESHSTGVSLT